MQKIAGVQTVRVSLNDGLTVLDLRAGNAVTLKQLRGVLKDNGFVSEDARLEAIGIACFDAGKLAFRVSGADELFVVVPGQSPTGYEDLKQRASLADTRLAQLKGVARLTKTGSSVVEVEWVR
jgi:hypothetical protein